MWDLVVPSIAFSSGSCLRSFFSSLSVNIWSLLLFFFYQSHFYWLFTPLLAFLMTLQLALPLLSVIFQQENEHVMDVWRLWPFIPLLLWSIGDFKLVLKVHIDWSFSLCHQHLIRHIFMLQSLRRVWLYRASGLGSIWVKRQKMRTRGDLRTEWEIRWWELREGCSNWTQVAKDGNHFEVFSLQMKIERVSEMPNSLTEHRQGSAHLGCHCWQKGSLLSFVQRQSE